MKVRYMLIFVVLFVASANVWGACGDAGSPLTSLIKQGTDDGKKVPLILIHGHQGVDSRQSVVQDVGYWSKFLEAFQQNPEAASKFTIYNFQYCSDREPVAKIAEQLRDAIDKQIADRQHVIVAHSLGGLVATSYTAETTHSAGKWKGKRCGDTILGLITLATPHHGTPGANDATTMQKFVPRSLSSAYDALHRIYWRSGPLPTEANRSDLRWDNYDGKLPANSKDINTAQAKRNAALAPYYSKIIAYAGTIDSDIDKLKLAAMLLQLRIGGGGQDEHNLLSLANVGLVNALGNKFGNADGLVPQVSALFCKPSNSTPRFATTFVCSSNVKVRRFEPIGDRDLENQRLPDASTLSIVWSGRGFDHLNMLTSPQVHQNIFLDLIRFVAPQERANNGKLEPARLH